MRVSIPGKAFKVRGQSIITYVYKGVNGFSVALQYCFFTLLLLRRLCVSRFLRLEYSVELLIQYSSTRIIPEVAIKYTVAQNKRTSGSLFKFNFVIQKRFELSQDNARSTSENPYQARLQLAKFTSTTTAQKQGVEIVCY